ncbi:MAG: serine/threonine-protein kinase [Myxococcota bacterium]
MGGIELVPRAHDLIAAPVLPAHLPRGWMLGGHVVDGWLRDGGMAAIYRGHRVRDGRRVAIKLQLAVTAGDAEVEALFDREADALGRVAGTEAIVELYEAGTLADGRRYLVLEWIDGEDLEELLDRVRNRDERLSIPRVCRIGQEIARGLATLHAHGLVHRDLKPANVMVSRAPDGTPVVKLLDFGLVAQVGTAGEGEGGTVRGTSAYMPREQRAGGPPAPSIDLYALGVVLFEALTGKCMPPGSWSPRDLPRRLDTLRKDVPARLAQLVQSCIHHDPQSRPASATEVTTRLAEVLRRLEAALVSADPSREEPGRMGGTLGGRRAALDHARTGTTEVALTHQDVLTQSGSSLGASLVAASGDAPIHGLDDGLDGGLDELLPRSRARWWVVASVAMLVVGGLWSWGSGRVFAALNGDAGVIVRAEAGVGSEPEVIQPRHWPVSPRVGAEPGAVAEPEPERPVPHADEAPRREVASLRERSPEHQPSRVSPGLRACDAKRREALAAKRARDWKGVLVATRLRACWSTPAQRLDRKRLRVTAFAERDDFDRCIAEAGRSRDPEVVARVRYCTHGRSG